MAPEHDGFAKLPTLADGHLDLHAGRSQVTLDRVAEAARREAVQVLAGRGWRAGT